MKRLPGGRATQSFVVIALALCAAIAVAVRSDASTPPSDAVTVPAGVGQTVQVTWTGTIPAASAHPANTCNGAGTPGQDEHLIQLTEPARGYENLTATFTFQIAWTPTSGAEDTNDEILTVNRSGPADEGDTEAAELGSSDGSDVKEVVVAHNLGSGQYTVLACGFANTTPQPYTGTLTVTTESPAADTGPRSVNAQGLAFSAAVPADPQRDEAEPLIEIAPDGHVYTCGPTGFSNGVDYAQVSTDHGDQFHVLGTQPRGQQGAGGGGDCSMATGQQPNAQGHYQYAYSGLGALSGFTTATSPNDGHSLATAGADLNGGVTTQGVLADRQWEVFTDATTALLSWNQQQPRNVVVVKSTDGGLTFSPVAAVAAPNPEFPGPMRYSAALGIVFMPWTKGEEVNLAISRDAGDTWTNCKVASGETVRGGTAGFAVADADSAGNVYVVWSDSDRYHVWMSTLAADKVLGCDEPVDQVAADKTTNGQPSVDPGFTEPVQVDRDEVRTTVFPWVAAGGAPGRVAVAYYGTPADGDPNVGVFDAAWDVYVDQSLDGGQSFGQVKATTHPFHYDSICLNGLGCDLAVPPGDRTLADFFAIGYSQADGRLYVVFNRTNKKPGDDLGHIATPMVVSQVAGPSNGGGTVDVDGRDAVRSASPDATGDALSSYSVTAPAVVPPDPPTQNEPAADFESATISPDAATGGFTVTLRVADLSTPALISTLAHTGGQSIEWIWRFTNGYQDAAASAAWSPAGWTFGYDDYTLGGTPCESAASAQGEKCQVYPQATAIEGSVDAAAGTITLVVPRTLLRQLSGADSAGRPLEAAADTGSRFYDGTAFSLVNTTSPVQAQQSFLYTLDNTPSMDFLLPAAPKGNGGGGNGGGGNSGGGKDGGDGGSSSGGGGPSSGGGGSPTAGNGSASSGTPSGGATSGVAGAQVTLTNGKVSVTAASVAPFRLLIDQVQFTPGAIASRSTPIRARVHVSDTRGNVVRDAVVFARGVPSSRLGAVAEKSTAVDGWVSFSLRPLARLPLKRDARLTMFLRARAPGEPLLGGVSVRRLVSLRVDPSRAGAPTVTSPQAAVVSAKPVENRLVVDRVQFTPSRIASRSEPLQVRVRVVDRDGKAVAGALVHVAGLPANRLSAAGEQKTGKDGWATFRLRPLRGLPLAKGARVVLFTRARLPGQPLLAGSSTRRLVSVAVG